MKFKVLFSAQEPPKSQVPFTGYITNNGNPEFEDEKYQVALMFEDLSEVMYDYKNNQIVNVNQHPIKIRKQLDIDTAFFKECVCKKYIIPEMSFYFFSLLPGDSYPINDFTVILKDVKVLQSKIVLPDLTSEQNLHKPVIEDILLLSSEVTWKYERNSDSMVGSKVFIFKQDS